jgi:hypothetical protein
MDNGRRDKRINITKEAMSHVRVSSNRTIPSSLVRDNVPLSGRGGKDRIARKRHIIMVQACTPEAGNCLPFNLVTRFRHPDRNIFCLYEHAGMYAPLCAAHKSSAHSDIVSWRWKGSLQVRGVQIQRTVSLDSSVGILNRLSAGRPPLWSSGQSFWIHIQRFRVRFPALPDFLRSSGSGTESTQPGEYNWGATWKK